MKAERTIAIIGDNGDFCPALAKQLAGENVRLLFVSNDEDKNVELKAQLGTINSLTEVEFTTCEKEGCWEADVIAFTHPEKTEPHLVQRIKEVATQKTVLILSDLNHVSEIEEKMNFEDLLPHSRVVYLNLDVATMKAEIFGKNKEAKEMVKGFFEAAGYKL